MKELHVGQQASVSRVFTAEDVASFRALTGDSGLHYGGKAKTAVPGPLLAGLFSYLLGTELPGYGTNWLKQKLYYLAVASVGEEITAVVEIKRLRPKKSLVNLHTTCANGAGEIVCEGEALVLIKDLKR